LKKTHLKSEKSEKSNESGNPGGYIQESESESNFDSESEDNGINPNQVEIQNRSGNPKNPGIRSERLYPGIVSGQRESEVCTSRLNPISQYSSIRIESQSSGFSVIRCCMSYSGGVPNRILKSTKS